MLITPALPSYVTEREQAYDAPRSSADYPYKLLGKGIITS